MYNGTNALYAEYEIPFAAATLMCIGDPDTWSPKG